MNLNKILSFLKILFILCFMNFIESAMFMINLSAEVPTYIFMLTIFAFTFFLRIAFIYYIFAELIKMRIPRRYIIFLSYPLLFTDAVIYSLLKVKSPIAKFLDVIEESFAQKYLFEHTLLTLFTLIIINTLAYEVWRFLVVYFLLRKKAPA